MSLSQGDVNLHLGKSASLTNDKKEERVMMGVYISEKKSRRGGKEE